MDAEIASQLRRAKRPVLLAVNKLDDLPDTTAHMAFYQLGLGDPIPLSAAIGKASGDLLDAIVERLPVQQAGELDEAINVAVVGRPNVGKSSLVNRLLGEDRFVVSPEAGTTRDAVDSVMRAHGSVFNFIDTAGLRKRARVNEDVEFYSTLRTQRAIERAAGVRAGDRRRARAPHAGPPDRDRGVGPGVRADHRGQQVGPDRGEGRQHRQARRG